VRRWPRGGAAVRSPGAAGEHGRGVRAGMNSGVLLLRNNEWTRNVMNEMMHYGRHPVNFTLEDVRPRSAAGLKLCSRPEGAGRRAH